MEQKRFIMEVVMKEIIFPFVLYLNSVYNLDISLCVGLTSILQNVCVEIDVLLP